jgi:hypothetical protein
MERGYTDLRLSDKLLEVPAGAIRVKQSVACHCFNDALFEGREVQAKILVED